MHFIASSLPSPSKRTLNRWSPGCLLSYYPRKILLTFFLPENGYLKNSSGGGGAASWPVRLCFIVLYLGNTIIHFSLNLKITCERGWKYAIITCRLCSHVAFLHVRNHILWSISQKEQLTGGRVLGTWQCEVRLRGCWGKCNLFGRILLIITCSIASWTCCDRV